MEYVKTKEDKKKEASDLDNDPVLRFLKHQENYKFKIGDILIKKNSGHWISTHGVDKKWSVEVTSSANPTPRKYMYVFENELGIGYIKQLKLSGKGFADAVTCMVSFDPNQTKFELDPSYIDHQIIGDGSFDHNAEYREARKFRKKALDEIKKTLIDTKDVAVIKDFFINLKKGDQFYISYDYDRLDEGLVEVVSIKRPKQEHVGSRSRWGYARNYNQPPEKSPQEILEDSLGSSEWRTIEIKHIKGNHAYTENLEIGDFYGRLLTLIRPAPLKDPLKSDPQR